MLRKIGLRCIHSFMVNHSFHLRSIDHSHQYFLYLQYLDLWGHTVINLFARDAFAQSLCSNYSVFWNVLYGGATLCDICICIACLFVLSFTSQPTQCCPNYTLTGQAKSFKRLTSTYEYSFYRNWISNETMAVDNISWAISTQECCRRRGWTRILLITSDAHPAEPTRPVCTVDSRYLEFQGTHWNTSRYPYLDISEFRERVK